jgi:hypothetical protein
MIRHLLKLASDSRNDGETRVDLKGPFRREEQYFAFRVTNGYQSFLHELTIGWTRRGAKCELSFPTSMASSSVSVLKERW